MYPYQTREVRDLAWACFSPALLLSTLLGDEGLEVTQCPLALTPQRQAWLLDLDRDATPLLRHLRQQRSHRLGVYFEHLWHFFLHSDPAVELIAHNLPIHYQGKTLGEFDCIYFCREREQYAHLELAVKFFLGHGECAQGDRTSAQEYWLGPNTADRLDLKVKHLLQRQIRLADRPEAQAQLEKLGIPGLTREIEIKGYLFNSLAAPLPPPRGFNTDRDLDTWLSVEQLDNYLSQSHATGYLVLPKTQWLAPAQLANRELGRGRNLVASPTKSPSTSEQLALDRRALHVFLNDLLSQDQRPQLVAALDDGGREIRRFFVTAPGWPHGAQREGGKAGDAT